MSKGTVSIGDYAFKGCTNMEGIKFGDKLESIGNCAFYGDKRIKVVFIPDSVTNIGTRIFDGFYNDRIYVFCEANEEQPGWNKYWREEYTGKYNVGTKFYPTYNCEVKDDFIYADSDYTVLRGYIGLEKNVVIPSSVEVIGGYSFSENSYITSVELSQNLTQIGYEAFKGCTNLQKIDFPEKLNKTESFAFQNCSSLTSLVIPSTLINIGYGTFCGCTNIKDVVYDAPSIPPAIFSKCTSLRSFYIPNMMPVSGDQKSNSPFYGCSSELKIYTGYADENTLVYTVGRGYNSCWRYYDSENKLDVMWGVTKEEYETKYKEI